MKFGSTLLLIIVIFIAFGFVISDDLQVRNDLGEVNQKLATCQNGVLNSQQIISQLEIDKEALIRKVAEKENEISSLKAEFTQQMEKKIPSTESSNFTFPISGEDPLVLAGILVMQIALNLVQKGWKSIRNNRKTKGEYIFLTPEEMAQIISSRRKK